MTDETTLVPVEQKTVNFYDDELLAYSAEDGQVYVSVRHLCDALGLARQGQVRRIRDDKILSEAYQGGNVLFPLLPMDVEVAIQRRRHASSRHGAALAYRRQGSKLPKKDIQPKLERLST